MTDGSCVPRFPLSVSAVGGLAGSSFGMRQLDPVPAVLIVPALPAIPPLPALAGFPPVAARPPVLDMPPVAAEPRPLEPPAFVPADAPATLCVPALAELPPTAVAPAIGVAVPPLPAAPESPADPGVPALEAGVGLPPELEHPMRVAIRNPVAEQRVRFLGTVVIIVSLFRFLHLAWPQPRPCCW
jgi:hypothetical protein